MPDLGQLRAFLEVVERGTVAAAADALGYTGPAVSQQVAKLERRLQAPLFDRVGGKLRPNRAGLRLVPIARSMLDLAEEAGGVRDALVEARPVTIAGFASALQALVVPVVAASERPELIEVLEVEDAEALRELRLGHVDVALTQAYDRGEAPAPAAVPVPAAAPPDAADPRLHATALLHDRLRLVLPGERPPSTSLGEAATLGWLFNGRGTRCEAAGRQVLERAGVARTVRGWVADNRTLLALVAAGHGATIVPELVLADAPPGLSVADVDLGAGRTIFAVTRRATTAQHRALLASLADAGARHAAGPGRVDLSGRRPRSARGARGSSPSGR
jgi:DNA-binding transcriptional LysR family regulator